MKPNGKPDEHGTLRVQVTSVDGSFTHPFKRTDTVGDVHEFAYPRLVQDKAAVPITATSVEVGGTAVADSQPLAALAAGGGKQPGSEIDLTLALTWASQGG